MIGRAAYWNQQPGLTEKHDYGYMIFCPLGIEILFSAREGPTEAPSAGWPSAVPEKII